MNRLLVSPSPHLHTKTSTKSHMRDVVIAMLPAVVVSVLFYGWSELLVLGVSVASCVLLEYLVTKYMLKKPCTVGDYSAVVTGVLLALNHPTTTHWWVVFIGAVVAVGVAKMTFGGLGQNLFNPAIAGRVFLLISFPTYMTDWTRPQGFIGGGLDAISGATPLGLAKEGGVAIDSTYFGKKPLKRSTLRESYEFVIRDLEKAEELLEDAPYGYSSPYFTYAAANAIHARTALYMQDWDDAIKYSTRLIEDEAYALSTAATYTTGVSPITGAQKAYSYIDYMWTNDLSTEVIWMVDYTITSYGGALGQSFLNFNNDYVYFYPDYVPSQWVLDLYAGNDARYGAYFTTLPTGYAHGLTWPLLTKYFGNEEFIANIIFHVSKPKPLRLGEQYLIRAEAYCMKNQFSQASADLTSLLTARHSGNASASLNASNWKETISQERVKELYMEGFRLQDLKRWNMGFERTPQTAAQEEGSSLKREAGDYRFVWPIPQNDIEAPGSQIRQNMGY